MKALLRAIDRRYYVVAPAERLAALRILVGGFAVVLLLVSAPKFWALASFSAGVIEETMLRFGLFTLVAAIAASAARGGAPPDPLAGPPPPFAFHLANVVAALVFGALHFGNAEVIGLALTPRVVTSILAGNALVGLVCGWLYWKRGLEAAMIAHTSADLVLHALVPALFPAAMLS